MSEQSPEAPADQTSEQPQEGGEQEPKTFDAEYVANLRKEAAKYRTEAKAAASELEKQRQASMSEADKAVAEAEARGRSAAATEYGTRLARSEFDALAGRRNAGFDTSAALEFVDLKKFLNEDGDVDSKAIKSAVERLVPEESTAASFDGGARTTAPKGPDMNSLLRKAAGRA
ncbi:hypothetical protein [Nocardioides kribbensis]|uniref:Scaffolding protein n=1 Tax=Nocardioides kribbensis TaxID=305517 RepID=A0ABV1NZ08_9ACTN